MSLSMSKSTQTLIRAIESTGMYKFPDGARYAAQDIDGTVKFYATKPRYVTGLGEWDTICSVVASVKLDTAINRYHKTLVTKAQFEVLVRLTPRPSEPKPYTRDEALQFLVERLDSWPTDIADAPLCPGWGWVRARVDDGCVFVHRANVELESPVHHHHWQSARPDFVPFVSVEDAQPATAKQPAPSGKGDPILGMVLADLTNRALEGREKYGEALKANNGRNALWDAYQEALDLAMYLRQAIEEQHRAQTDR